jgi:hypothetical protein
MRATEDGERLEDDLQSAKGATCPRNGHYTALPEQAFRLAAMVKVFSD